MYCVEHPVPVDTSSPRLTESGTRSEKLGQIVSSNKMRSQCGISPAARKLCRSRTRQKKIKTLESISLLCYC